MYDREQEIILDYLLRLSQVPLVALEAKSEEESAEDAMQQASRYANRLGLRFSLGTNGRNFILTDNATGAFETLTAPPSPGDILAKLGYQLDWAKWRSVFEYPWHVDQITQKKVRPYQEAAIFETLLRFASGTKRCCCSWRPGPARRSRSFS